MVREKCTRICLTFHTWSMLFEFNSLFACHKERRGVLPGQLTEGYIMLMLNYSAPLKDLWETEGVFSVLQQQQSRISQFNTSLFKHSASASQRLMKGHLVGWMKTWQQPELERLALLSYQRHPQPARLNQDFVWKSVSIAEILGPRAGWQGSSSSLTSSTLSIYTNIHSVNTTAH